MYRMLTCAVASGCLLLGTTTASATSVLDTFAVDGLPEGGASGPGLFGSLSQDGDKLVIDLTTTGMGLSGTNAYVAAIFHTGTGPGTWDGAYLLLDNFYSNGLGDPTWGVGSGGSHPWMNQGTLPANVSMNYTIVGDDIDWTMEIALDALGLSVGDSFSYFIGARLDDSGNNYNGDELSLNFSHGTVGYNPLYFPENFQTASVIPTPVASCVGLVGLALLGSMRGMRQSRDDSTEA